MFVNKRVHLVLQGYFMYLLSSSTICMYGEFSQHKFIVIANASGRVNWILGYAPMT